MSLETACAPKTTTATFVPAQDSEQVRLHGGRKQVFAADFETAVSANPYIQFKFRAEESGQVVLSWTDDDGSTIVGQDSITVI